MEIMVIDKNELFWDLLPNPHSVDYTIEDNDGNPVDYYTEAEMQRFAERLIRKCSYVIDNILDEGSPGSDTLGEQLMQYFGVEK
jgi:hypothetical protein